MTRFRSPEELRDHLMKVGEYDLTKPEDALRLRKKADAQWRWMNSSLADAIKDPDIQKRGPVPLLRKVEFKNRQMTTRNHMEVMNAIRNYENIVFMGTGAILAAIAFGKQYCFEKKISAHYLTMADVNTDNLPMGEVRTLGTSTGDLLVLDLHPNPEGRVWAEEQKRMVAALRSHTGPVILLQRTNEGPNGELCSLALKHFEPIKRFPIVRKK